MNRADVTELRYITAIANVPSIMELGILSNALAGQLTHDSVSMPEIQERRRNKQIRGARRLHDYANLYFDAHNPMLSRCRGSNNEICVLRVNPAVLDQPDVIITDRNAAADLVGFWPVNDGLVRINFERVFARLWLHRDDPQADTTNLEGEIDRLVYKLYDLTDNEITIVEESTAEASLGAAVGATAQETSIPLSGIRYWGGGSPVERIRFAGANRLLLEFDYHGKHRLVEPYSLRHRKTGNLCVYAWELNSRHIKAFKIDEMVNARSTITGFRPRYRVELSAQGP